jgi:hypothetical protein
VIFYAQIKDKIMDLFIPIMLLLLIAAIVLFIIWRALGGDILTIRDGQQLVVYRLGRFHRLVNPGLGLVWRSFETVEQTINQRDQPHDLVLDGFFVYDIPFGYTLNLWYRNDPAGVAGADRARLAHLVQFDDDERRNQVAAIVRNAMVHSLTEVQKSHPLPNNSTFVQKLLPIFPGTPGNLDLIDRLGKELVGALPAIGVVVNQAQPIVIKKIHVSDDLVANFRRGRTVALLREQVPDLSQPMLMHMLSAIEGLDVSQIQQINLQQSGAEVADVKLKLPRATEDAPRLDVKPRAAANASYARANDMEGDARQGEPVPQTDHLTADDLRTLKRVPRVRSAA